MKNADKRKSTAEIVDIHTERLEKALQHTAHLLPFQSSTFAKLTDNELSYLDMLTTRFAKLQDMIGSKVFPLLIELLQESQEGDSTLDRLHKLEKLGFLNTDEWITMRELRNHITHEYPDNPELMASNLNRAVEQAKNLIAFWKKLKIQFVK